MARYSQAEWRPFPSSGRYTGGPKRLVLHTTEGYSITGAEAAYRAKNVAPHFTLDPRDRVWVQHVDTAVAASAMANKSGGVQTNRRSAIQVEIVGFAGQTQHLADGDLGWIGKVLFAICWAEGIPMHVHPPFVGTEAGTIASASAPQRMSFAKWDSFHGVCGHQHVPENHHWDPGRFPYDRMMRLITPEDDMFSDDDRKRLARLEELLKEAVIDTRAIEPRSKETTIGVRTLLRRSGLSDSEIDGIVGDVLAGLDPTEIAKAIVRTGVKEAVLDALREGTG